MTEERGSGGYYVDFSAIVKMVAQKRGRGAKAQAAKAKVATPAAEEQVPDSEVVESTEENNGQTEQNEHAEGGAGDGAGVGQEGEQAENADGDAKAEDKKEDKVESGKLLVENLPSSYLFDYQEKLKELFSKHGEVISVK